MLIKVFIHLIYVEEKECHKTQNGVEMRKYTKFEIMFFLVKEEPRTKLFLEKFLSCSLKTIENINKNNPDVFEYSRKNAVYTIAGFIPKYVPSILVYELKKKFHKDLDLTFDMMEAVVLDGMNTAPFEVKNSSDIFSSILFRYFRGDEIFKDIGDVK